MKLRPEVRWWAERMERKLRKKDKERGKEGWKNADPKRLLQMIEGHTQKLRERFDQQVTVEATAQDCIDVSNLAMMLADVLRFRATGKFRPDGSTLRDWSPFDKHVQMYPPPEEEGVKPRENIFDKKEKVELEVDLNVPLQTLPNNTFPNHVPFGSIIVYHLPTLPTSYGHRHTYHFRTWDGMWQCGECQETCVVDEGQWVECPACEIKSHLDEVPEIVTSVLYPDQIIRHAQDTMERLDTGSSNEGGEEDGS